MLSLGALVEDSLRLELTHFIWSNGSIKHVKAAELMDIKVLSPLWVECCVKTWSHVPESEYIVESTQLSRNSVLNINALPRNDTVVGQAKSLREPDSPFFSSDQRLFNIVNNKSTVTNKSLKKKLISQKSSQSILNTKKNDIESNHLHHATVGEEDPISKSINSTIPIPNYKMSSIENLNNPVLISSSSSSSSTSTHRRSERISDHQSPLKLPNKNHEIPMTVTHSYDIGPTTILKVSKEDSIDINNNNQKKNYPIILNNKLSNNNTNLNTLNDHSNLTIKSRLNEDNTKTTNNNNNNDNNSNNNNSHKDISIKSNVTPDRSKRRSKIPNKELFHEDSKLESDAISEHTDQMKENINNNINNNSNNNSNNSNNNNLNKKKSKTDDQNKITSMSINNHSEDLTAPVMKERKKKLKLQKSNLNTSNNNGDIKSMEADTSTSVSPSYAINPTTFKVSLSGFAIDDRNTLSQIVNAVSSMAGGGVEVIGEDPTVECNCVVAPLVTPCRYGSSLIMRI